VRAVRITYVDMGSREQAAGWWQAEYDPPAGPVEIGPLALAELCDGRPAPSVS
jgi:hypothetical protein